MTQFFPRFGRPAFLSLFFALLLAACSDSSDFRASFDPEAEERPIVFVHGQFGSAIQFETQAMRFTSNGYPAELLFAFEYDTAVQDNPVQDLDAFIDNVIAATGEDEVFVIGHSRGTSLSIAYLEDPDLGGAAKVARYVNVDGRSQDTLPGDVPTIGIWGEWNTANSGYNRREDNSNAQIGPEPEDNHYFSDKSHTEVLTSPEAFTLMYEFFTGIPAATSDVTEVENGPVDVAGRVLFFAENIGYAGVTLQVWPIADDTGQRTSDSPMETLTIPDSGDFGPLSLEAGRRYEFTVLRDATEAIPVETEHHFFLEPFYHDNQFVRLLTTLPGSSIEAFIPRLEDAQGLLMLRQKEFWGDQGALSDELFINGLNMLTPLLSPRETGNGAGANLAAFAFDAGGDSITELERGELFPFNTLTFLTGADIFIPAQAGGQGVTEISLVHRGGETTQLNVPNWPSTEHLVSVYFRDDR